MSLSDRSISVYFTGDPVRTGAYGCYATDAWKLFMSSSVGVRGFTLDGYFVMVWHEQRHPGSQQLDASIEPGSLKTGVRSLDHYSLGTKTMLVIPLCPGDLSEAECASTFNRHLVRTDVGGNIVAYLEAVIDNANAFFSSASRSRFQLKATILSPVRLSGYGSASCGGSPAVGWNSWSPNSEALDTQVLLKWHARRASTGPTSTLAPCFSRSVMRLNGPASGGSGSPASPSTLWPRTSTRPSYTRLAITWASTMERA